MRGWVWGGLLLALVVMAGQSAAQSTTTPGGAVEASARENITLAIAIIGAITGMFGAGLSAYNTYVAREARKVRLKVIPGWSFAPGYMAFSIEVVNLSAITVIVDQIGFLERGTKRTLPIVNHMRLTDSGEWPRKLGPQESVSVHLDPNVLPTGVRLGKAFAQTVSDERGTATNGAHKQLAHLVETGTLALPPHFGGMPSLTIRTIHARPAHEVGKA